jgi:hypothetical protein
MPERVRGDPVHRLSQVEVQVLGRAAPAAVHRDGSDRRGHERNPDARAQPVAGRHDRILAGEAHRPARVSRRQPHLAQQHVQGR